MGACCSSNRSVSVSPQHAKNDHLIRSISITNARTSEESSAADDDQFQHLIEPQQSILEPAAEADETTTDQLPDLAGPKRQFFRDIIKAWRVLLRLCFQDIEFWDKEEALLRSHVLMRLVLQDIDRSMAVLAEPAPGENILEAASPDPDMLLRHQGESTIYHFENPEDRHKIPVVVTLFPADIVAQVPTKYNLFRWKVHQCLSQSERDEMRRECVTMKEEIVTGDNFENIKGRWQLFSTLMTAFGCGDKFNFELQLSTLLSPTTMDEWVKQVTGLTQSLRQVGRTYTWLNTLTGTGPPNIEPQTFETQASLAQETVKVKSQQPQEETRRHRRRRSFRRSLSRVRHHNLLYRRHRGVSKEGLDEHAWTQETKRGVVLAYKMLPDGNVACKVRSVISIPFTAAMITLDDYERFVEWVPYCIKAEKLATFSTACYLLSYISDLPWPIKKKETLGFCGCVEALKEVGQVIVYVMTPPVGDSSILGHPLPPENPKIPRIKKSFIAFFVRPLSLNETALEIRAIMDPGMNSRMLRGVIPWVVKNTVLDFFAKIVGLANAVDMDAVRQQNHPHQAFYDSMEQRVIAYLEEQELQSSPRAPLNTQPSRFDETDNKWFLKLQSFHLD